MEGDSIWRELREHEYGGLPLFLGSFCRCGDWQDVEAYDVVGPRVRYLLKSVLALSAIQSLACAGWKQQGDLPQTGPDSGQ